MSETPQTPQPSATDEQHWRVEDYEPEILPPIEWTRKTEKAEDKVRADLQNMIASGPERQ